jgi:SAM-dependent methyltransferase
MGTTGISQRRRLKNAVIRARFPLKGTLARAYLRSVERYRTLRGGYSGVATDGALPVPPARLRVLVGGTPEADWFLRSGRAHADYLRMLVARVGRPLDGMESVLDLGCGCGRIARWFSDLRGPQLHGCDYNDELISWCRANLTFMKMSRNRLRPPLPYPDGAFDFIYVYSVFTHLSIELAAEWMTEIGRVVRPGGLIWFTLHGASYRERLAPEDKIRFDNGEIVVWLPEIEGTNLCGSYWPEAAVRAMLPPGFEILHHMDPNANPSAAESLLLTQDAYLARRVEL